MIWVELEGKNNLKIEMGVDTKQWIHYLKVLETIHDFI